MSDAPQAAPPPAAGPPGGKYRGEQEVEELTDQVEQLMLYATPDRAICKQLGLPQRTLNDYKARVRERWAAEAPLEREETRKRQIRRLSGRLRTAISEKRHKDAHAIEQLIAKLEGNETDPALIDRLVEIRLAEIMDIARSRLTTAAPARTIAQPDAPAPAEPEADRAGSPASQDREPDPSGNGS